MVFLAEEVDEDDALLVVFFGAEDPAFDDDSDESFFANGILYGLIFQIKVLINGKIYDEPGLLERLL